MTEAPGAPLAELQTPALETRAESPAASVAPRARAHAPASEPAGVGGQVIAIDPETGLPGAPSPEQMRALRASAPAGATRSRNSEGLVEIRHPDGTVTAVLDERFHEFAIVSVDSHGTAHFGCLHHHDGLAKAKRDSLPPPALEEK